MKKIFIFLIAIIGLTTTTIAQNYSFRTWTGKNNDNLYTKFKLMGNKNWCETNKNGSYKYIEIENIGGNIKLKDKQREGVYIFLTEGKCYYKNSNNDWMLIYIRLNE